MSQATPPTTTESEGQALLMVGQAYMSQGQNGRAEETLLAAVDALEREEDTKGEADTRLLLVALYLRLQKYEEAEAQIEETLLLHQQTGNLEEEAVDYQFAYMLHMSRKNYEKADEALVKAIEIHRKRGSKDLEGNAEVFRAQLWEAQGDKQKAIGRFEAALALFAEAKDAKNAQSVSTHLKKLRGSLPVTS